MGAMADLAKRHHQNQLSGDTDGDRRIFTEDVVTVFPGRGTIRGLEDFVKVSEEFSTAFSDQAWDYGVVLEDAHSVAIEGVWHTTNTGPLKGPAGEIPATNKRIRLPFVDVMVGRNGKISEHRIYFDQADFMQQLGLMPG